MSRPRLFVLAAIAAFLLQLPLGQPAAHAASAVEAQNPALTVSLTVPDQATVGETVAATMSISNNTATIQPILVKGIWTDPAGEATVRSQNGLLLPGQTVTRVVDYRVDERSLPGIHQITLTVESRGRASSATAAIEVI